MSPNGVTPPPCQGGKYDPSIFKQKLFPADAECSAQSLLSIAWVIRRSGFFGHEGEPARRVVLRVADLARRSAQRHGRRIPGHFRAKLRKGLSRDPRPGIAASRYQCG